MGCAYTDYDRYESDYVGRCDVCDDIIHDGEKYHKEFGELLCHECYKEFMEDADGEI